jgi:hypothetical protein
LPSFVQIENAGELNRALGQMLYEGGGT